MHEGASEPAQRHRGSLVAWPAVVGLGLVLGLAGLFRFWQLRTIPPGFHYDEAFEALEAWRVLTQPGYHPIFFPGNFGVEPMFIYLTSAAFGLLGASPTVMRGVAALLGVLNVAALYGLGRELVRADDRIPRAMPLLAAVALAIMRWHVHFSRVGIEPILVPLFLTLVFWAFWRGLQGNSWGSWLALGASTGMTVYIYPAARLLPLMLAATVLLIRLIDPSRLRGRWRGLATAAGVAAILSVPLVWHFLQNPDQFLLRSSQIAVASPAESGGGFIHNLVATLGSFSWRGDADPRNNVPGMPALDPLISIPFYLGLGIAVWRCRHPVHASLIVALAFMLVPTVYSEYAPHFRRAIGATPLIALFCGLGLATILGWVTPRAQHGDSGMPEGVFQPGDTPWRVAQSGLPADELSGSMETLRRVGRIIIVGALLLGSAVLSATAYFQVWGRANGVYYAYDEGLWQIGQYVLGLPADEMVYVTPRPASDATLSFAWREGRQVSHFDGRHAFVAPISRLAAGLDATYILIEHEDGRATLPLHDLFPDAIEVKSFQDRSGQQYARAYRVPGGSQPLRRPANQVKVAWPEVGLAGYDLDKTTYAPGQIVFLQLWWDSKAPVTTDWKVFTHIVGASEAGDHEIAAGMDGQPGYGSTPMRTWSPGDLVLDEYQIQLPSDMRPGEYAIEVGLYDPAVSGKRAITSEPPGQDRAVLQTIRVE